MSSAKWRPFCLGLNVLKPPDRDPAVYGIVISTLQVGSHILQLELHSLPSSQAWSPSSLDDGQLRQVRWAEYKLVRLMQSVTKTKVGSKNFGHQFWCLICDIYVWMMFHMHYNGYECCAVIIMVWCLPLERLFEHVRGTINCTVSYRPLDYREVSNIRRTKSHNLNVSRLIL